MVERRDAPGQPYLRGRVLGVGCGSGSMLELVPPDRSVGVEPDAEMLALARRRFPQHRFLAALPDNDEFDTVASLAMIEHVRDSAGFLGPWAGRLKHPSAARIVCTTPHPAVDWLHTAGARCGCSVAMPARNTRNCSITAACGTSPNASVCIWRSTGVSSWVAINWPCSAVTGSRNESFRRADRGRHLRRQHLRQVQFAQCHRAAPDARLR